MRISVIETDPGYVQDCTIFWKVQLDGEELPLCVTADEETGEAWVLELGHVGGPETRRVTGRVVIVRDEGEGVMYAEGTVGLIDEDRFFVWCDPSNPLYAEARAKATHFWDHQAHRWYRTADLRRS